ncbi:MAG TPA: hypothetical protein EYG88_13090 [Desulfocapsa sulfexigens]|nr:hypothetical protein [Desulfocapsa sulfexigens]
MKQIRLFVNTEVPGGFTTLLQGGIFLKAEQGETIGDLITSLPGFTMEYARQKIQTIFLDGLPADDLDQQLWGKKAVIAISAAMPGLAGAIFRKGGMHASLRTETAGKLSENGQNTRPLQVRLKLFNMIAAERGLEILDEGCVLPAAALEKFFAYRLPLLATVHKVMMDDNVTDTDKLRDSLQSDNLIRLSIRSTNGG